MEARIEERVDGWSSRRFTGGYDGLRDLADEEFSGVVELDGGPWACTLNGKVIGVFDGRIEDFDGESGTTYAAPDPAVPLLFAMQERGGTLEEQYYTKDTPISEADRTLTSGSFVGYLELSENILSGDYYVCYYGGRSMPVAFVGNSQELVTGDEAFEKADDEVGIYDVYSVDMDVVEIPGGTETTEAVGSEADTTAAGTENGNGHGTEAGASPTGPESGYEGTAVDDPLEESTVAGDDRADSPPDAGDDRRPGSTAQRRAPEADADDGGVGDDENAPTRDDRETERIDEPDETDVDDILYGDGPGGRGESRDARTGGPSPDDRSTVEDRERGSADAGDGPTGGDRREPGQTDGRGSPAAGVDPTAVDRLRDRLEDHDGTIEVLKDQLSVAKREHDQFEEAHDRIDGDLDELREAVGTLESDLQEIYRRVDRLDDRLDALDGIERRLESLEAGGSPPAESTADGTPTAGGGRPEAGSGPAARDAGRDEAASPSPDAGRSEVDAGGRAAGTGRNVESGGSRVELSPGEALRETNLLVRYDSKGRATLETAHRGDADAGEVNENLRLDTHTSFEEDGATVEGRPFEEFLTDRIEYEFVEWLIRDLPYEVRDTGNADALGGLYDAVPEIDRIEMNAPVEVPVEDGEAETVTFDVVVRDKSGQPLVVANFNDSRDPATKDMVVDLEESARKLRTVGDLRAAMLVTTSYFGPDALETVEAATGGSLLSRDSKKSYVKLNRKKGYHLCLVESREGDFHLNVPEL